MSAGPDRQAAARTVPRPAAPQRLAALFLVSAASVGYEIALTRYFAVSGWSEYGYWVISIVMAGFALSGVALSLVRPWAMRRGAALLRWLPVAMLAAAALGFHFTAANPFNPLQLQNPATWLPQLGNIAMYYAALLPFFFLAGLFVGLCFVLDERRIGLVYGFDLTGAGAGAALVLGLMWVVHPFHLVAVLLLPLAGAALLASRPRRSAAAAGAVLLAAESLLLLASPARYNEFKAIYPPLHVQGSRVVAEATSPRGAYALLDDFTERVDDDLSNDAGLLGLPGPPATYGLYRDGVRVAGLPRPGGLDVGYAAAGLDALPYALLHRPDVLLVGASGGFRAQAALALGAGHVTAIETDPVLLGAARHGLGPSPALPASPALVLSGAGPLAMARLAAVPGGRYDLVDISADILDASEGAEAAFTVEALAADLRALRPGGLLSVPVSIRDLPAYALRGIGAARAALLATGAAAPALDVAVVRSAWNVRILVSPDGFAAPALAALRQFCDQRSFDVSYLPGPDVGTAAGVEPRGEIYNDLPPVSFEAGTVSTQDGPQDAIADEAALVLDGRPTLSGQAFDLRPPTLDRPFAWDILRLWHLPTVLRRLELLPQAEIGQLVNVAVLLQAGVLAALVLLVPALFAGRIRGQGRVLAPAVTFACLGLGFLFIEIDLIGRAGLYLEDRTSAFAVVLTGMLVFSGVGSLAAGRMARPLAWAGPVILGWCVAAWAWLQPLMVATLDLPWGLRVALVLAVLAPVSVALGVPFPAALSRGGRGRPGEAGSGAPGPGFLPWAWALNGAFSVVATPLANLLAIRSGYGAVLLCAAFLYGAALLSFSRMPRTAAWQTLPT